MGVYLDWVKRTLDLGTQNKAVVHFMLEDYEDGRFISVHDGTRIPILDPFEINEDITDIDELGEDSVINTCCEIIRQRLVNLRKH